MGDKTTANGSFDLDSSELVVGMAFSVQR